MIDFYAVDAALDELETDQLLSLVARSLDLIHEEIDVPRTSYQMRLGSWAATAASHARQYRDREGIGVEQ